jgi:peptidoglycan/xylan/chitin deacetylase (PgdA/CDA1 family)
VSADESLAVSVLRSAPVTGVSRMFTRGRLRILAYHGVPDAALFDAQMEYLAAKYTPVHEDDVAEAIHRGGSLPKRAAWVTFDDGDPTVVANGLPALERLGIPATMFVCPGLIETDMPFWWRLTDWVMAEMPERAEIFALDGQLTEYVKTVTDGRRREIVNTLLSEAQRPLPHGWRQLDERELARWTSAGMALGNHSWDHPCLDMVDPDSQRAQVTQTHDWLCDHLGRAPRSFAYPNGNFSDVVDAQVAELGYELGVLYDNRLTKLSAASPLQLSRVMLEADQPARRLKGVLSGAQPAFRSLLTKLGR